MLWQLVQETPRRSWIPPAKFAWCPLSWQVRQVLLTSSAFMPLNDRMGPGSPFSMFDFRCSVVSPWQEAHDFARSPWRVDSKALTADSWQTRHSVMEVVGGTVSRL